MPFSSFDPGHPRHPNPHDCAHFAAEPHAHCEGDGELIRSSADFHVVLPHPCESRHAVFFIRSRTSTPPKPTRLRTFCRGTPRALRRRRRINQIQRRFPRRSPPSLRIPTCRFLHSIPDIHATQTHTTAHILPRNPTRTAKETEN